LLALIYNNSNNDAEATVVAVAAEDMRFLSRIVNLLDHRAKRRHNVAVTSRRRRHRREEFNRFQTAAAAATAYSEWSIGHKNTNESPGDDAACTHVLLTERQGKLGKSKMECNCIVTSRRLLRWTQFTGTGQRRERERNGPRRRG